MMKDQEEHSNSMKPKEKLPGLALSKGLTEFEVELGWLGEESLLRGRSYFDFDFIKRHGSTQKFIDEVKRKERYRNNKMIAYDCPMTRMIRADHFDQFQEFCHEIRVAMDVDGFRRNRMRYLLPSPRQSMKGTTILNSKSHPDHLYLANKHESQPTSSIGDPENIKRLIKMDPCQEEKGENESFHTPFLDSENDKDVNSTSSKRSDTPISKLKKPKVEMNEVNIKVLVKGGKIYDPNKQKLDFVRMSLQKQIEELEDNKRKRMEKMKEFNKMQNKHVTQLKKKLRTLERLIQDNV